MTAVIAPFDSTLTWQQELRHAYTRLPDLLRVLGLDNHLQTLPAGIVEHFPLRVPRGFVARMRPGDIHDPLLRQVLPLAEEAAEVPGFVADPVGDVQALRSTGLLQKYHGRALLVTTGACAVHCRYCFRREFPYADQASASAHEAIGKLRADPSVSEAILSGGDPLSLGDGRLQRLLDQLDAIDHLATIRIHTRMPVVLPERVDARLLEMLAGTRKSLVMVLHVNHAQEIDAGVLNATRQLRSVCTAVLNQSVLLRGVNDSADALAELSTALFAAGILPYYLHQLDPVAGAAHFAVPDDEAVALVAAVTRLLPGYLVPRLVRELAGAPSKVGLPASLHKANRAT